MNEITAVSFWASVHKANIFRMSYQKFSHSLTSQIAPKFDSRLGNTAAEMPVKCQSNTIIMTSNLAASRLHEIWRKDVRLLND